MAWKILFEEPVPESARGRTMLIRLGEEELRESVPDNAIMAIVEVDEAKNARRIRFKLEDKPDDKPEDKPEDKPGRSCVFWLDD